MMLQVTTPPHLSGLYGGDRRDLEKWKRKVVRDGERVESNEELRITEGELERESNSGRH